MQKDDRLLERFVAAFPILDGDLFVFHDDSIPEELSLGIDPNDWGRILWRPAQIDTDPSAVEKLNSRLPKPLPKLYERLVSTYRWMEVDLRCMRLLPNLPGPDLFGLEQEITADPIMFDVLSRASYVQFGRDPSYYDPICFDLSSRDFGDDCPIVWCNHEAILMHERIGEPRLLYPSFRELVHDVIGMADDEKQRRKGL